MTDELAKVRQLTDRMKNPEPEPEPVAPANPTGMPADMLALLGSYYQPVPFGISVGRAMVQGVDVVMLIIEDGYGRQAYPLSPDEAKVIAAQLVRNTSGLITPT